jgi:hypothetical protein
MLLRGINCPMYYYYYYYYYYYLSCRSLWSIGPPFGGLFGRAHRCSE